MRLVVIESPLAAPSAKEPCTCRPILDGQGHSSNVEKCERCWRVLRELAENKRYLDAALADSLKRNEAPFASHRLYPGVLDDDVPEQRKLGMEAGFAWGEKADLVAVYVDRGVSWGMQEGIARAKARGQAVEERTIVGWERK